MMTYKTMKIFNVEDMPEECICPFWFDMQQNTARDLYYPYKMGSDNKPLEDWLKTNGANVSETILIKIPSNFQDYSFRQRACW